MDQKAQREKAALDLKIARADAIHNYAALEQALSWLLSILLNIPKDQAGIVFFNIIASRSRDKILEGLLEKKFGSKYDTYWHGIAGTPGVKAVPGLFALLGQLATIRNFVVHWTISTNIGDSEITESLIPPNIWGFADDQRSLTVQDLEAFSAKAAFVAGSISMFNIITSGLWTHDDGPTPWPDIFQQPCIYPPAEGHPLIQSKPKPPDQPRPSGG